MQFETTEFPDQRDGTFVVDKQLFDQTGASNHGDSSQVLQICYLVT